MLYFFLIGVQMDLWIIKKINRTTFLIGFCTVVVPMILTTICSLLLMQTVEPRLANSLPLVGQAESVLAFPMVASFLAELKIINSEFGKVALSSSMVSGLCSFTVITMSVLLHETTGNKFNMLTTLLIGIAFAIVIVFAIRPAVLWMIRRNPIGQPLRQSYIVAILLGILVTGFISQATGLHVYYGPLILGITIPAGPPVGSALVERIELLTSWIFMPVFFAKVGLVINIFDVKLKNYCILQFLALVGAFGKFLGAFLTSLYCNMPVKDAILLGLVLNAQGLLELGLFKMMKRRKVIENDAFIVMCISMLVVVGAITPIIKYLYDPSRRYVVYRRRTVMHSRPDSELRVLVCIHDQENVPVAINILEALNPTRRSPLIVYVLHLIELVGRANPILISHKLTNMAASKNSSPSERIVNAFRYYEQSNHDLVKIFPSTAISPKTTMHDDVCSIALNKRTSLILIPFHKRILASGAMELNQNTVRIVNSNVLEKAPCSVAIIIDRGQLKSSRSIVSSWSSYHVAILFLGGPDDREALALGARMAAHPNVNLTMIRLVENGHVTRDDVEERRLDNEAVSEFRHYMTGNYRVMYVEEVVTDGTGTVAVIRSMGNNYELVMVGRRQVTRSLLIKGLVLWNEQSELGSVGEVLACSEFMGNSTILVVQQHTNVVIKGQEDRRETIRDRKQHPVEDDAEDVPIQRIE